LPKALAEMQIRGVKETNQGLAPVINGQNRLSKWRVEAARESFGDRDSRIAAAIATMSFLESIDEPQFSESGYGG
jgi:hypothetical protein